MNAEGGRSAENGAPEARCYGHVFDPAHQGDMHHVGMDGWPAHEWRADADGACQQCPDPVTSGDRYVCVEGGVVHVHCIPALDQEVLNA